MATQYEYNPAVDRVATTVKPLTFTKVTIAPNGIFQPPPGIWMIIADNSAIKLEIIDAGVWKGAGPPAGIIKTDGSRLRINNTDPVASHDIFVARA